jgi:hypothetical protein
VAEVFVLLKREIITANATVDASHLALFGSLLVVVVTAWLNTKALSSQIEALRAEMKQGFAEFRLQTHDEMAAFRLDVHDQMSDVRHRLERLEEQRGLVRP